MKYISCEALEQGIAFMHNYVTICCNVAHKGGGFDNNPYKLYDGNIVKVDWKDFFKVKNGIRTQNMTDHPYPACEGCLYLMNMDWSCDNSKLSYFNFNHWKDCDTNCIYCGVKCNPGKEKTHKVYPCLKELKELDLIEECGMVMFGGGDIAFLPEFKKIVNLFYKYNYSFNIATSAAHYVNVLEILLKKGMAEVRISTDSATEETYKKIKKTNFYNAVWANIRKYAKVQKIPYCVRLKYILIPNINDNQEEILLWLQKAKESGVASVLFDIEAHYYTNNRYKIPKRILDLFVFAKEQAEKMGFYFLIFDHASQMLSENNNLLSDYYFYNDITQYKIKENIRQNKNTNDLNIWERIFRFICR